MKEIRIIVLMLLIVQGSFAQKVSDFKWWNPSINEFHVVDGQGWPNEVVSIFDRLPARAEKNVSKQSWDLSRQSAGLSIRFWSNADSIHVKYKVKGEISNTFISPLGVSGLDLYSKSSDGDWMRYCGEYDFDSIINCNFKVDDSTKIYKTYGREYQLFLPLFNEVESLEIGINKKSIFNTLPIRNEKPIVAYGTAICQGINASCPGMFWTNLLQRKLDRPLVNLGFSSNGKLEPELVDLISEVDAKLYILDCSSNLTPNERDVYQLVINAVEKLRIKRPKVPIILTEHLSFSNGATNNKNRIHSEVLDEELSRAFEYLKNMGIINIHLLMKSDFVFNIDSYADFIHPNDYGMIQYAEAYENLIRKVLSEPRGEISTTIPKTQSRDIAVYNWEERHQEILKLNKSNSSKICLFGDSIINFWGGEPETSIPNGKDSWEHFMKPIGVRNYGFGYDYLENVLWRIHHDELDGVDAEKIVLMIGTNNLSINNDSEIIDGLIGLVEAIKERQPNSIVLL